MPPESFSYPQARQELSAAQKLRAEFDAAVAASRQTGDRTAAHMLKTELQVRVAALQERLFPLERELRLKEQYAAQAAILENAGILTLLSSGEKGIFGIDGHPYPFPARKEVLARMREKQDILKEKASQGFTKLLMVPFGMKLDDLSQAYGHLLRKHHAEGRLLAAKVKDTDPDKPLDLDTATPLWRWGKYPQADENGTLLYEPKAFSPQDPQGQTKAQILAEKNSGWRILLVEQDPIIPREGQGQNIAGRQRLEANKTPQEYRQIIGQGPYAYEAGLTPEDWLTQALTQLTEKNQVLDDWQGHGSLAYLTGAYFPASGDVSAAYWNRGNRQADLGGGDPGSRDPGLGARSLVRV